MPNYQYKGRNQEGSLMKGRLQAVSSTAVAANLFERNITPIDIIELSANANNSFNFEKFKRFFIHEKVEATELIIFSRQMHSLSKAGMPLDRSLHGLEASISSIPLRKVLRDIASQLEKGLDLAGAMGRHPETFPPLYLSLIHVGENTGRIDLAFQQIARNLERDRETVKQVKSATRYPLFVFIAIAIALGILTVFVIPVFADTFEKLDAELPWQTQVLISVSNFAVAYWPGILLGLIASIFGFKHYIGTADGCRKWDKKKLRLPLIGNIFERVALSRFSRTFAMMMKAGVPIVQSLGVISQAVGNKYIGDNVIKMRESISHGDSLYQAALKSQMFSPLILQMISVGEESGNIDDLLDEVADFYDTEVEYDLKKLSSAIEPILIVFIAGLVLVLALGVFLPIWDLSSAAQ